MTYGQDILVCPARLRGRELQRRGISTTSSSFCGQDILKCGEGISFETEHKSESQSFTRDNLNGRKYV